MAKLTCFVFAILLLTAQPLVTQAWLYEVARAAAGVALVTLGAPIALGAAGFGTAGIVGGSLAAKAMSAAYVSQVGLGAISFLQAAGATGFGLSSALFGGAVGAGAAHYAGSHAED